MTETSLHSMAQPTVLLVEDEPRYREMLLEAVTGMGFEAKGVSSAEQALRAMAQQAFGIVVLDLNLPGMNGMDALPIIRRDHPSAQVIILTGFGDLQAAKKAMRCDVVDFITKPCQLDELEMALSRAHSRRRRGIATSTFEPGPEVDDANASLGDLERSHILSAMRRHHGNRRAVAGELGISLRTLYNRLKDYKELKSYSRGKANAEAGEGE